jgi:hypothetical protein
MRRLLVHVRLSSRLRREVTLAAWWRRGSLLISSRRWCYWRAEIRLLSLWSRRVGRERRCIGALDDKRHLAMLACNPRNCTKLRPVKLHLGKRSVEYRFRSGAQIYQCEMCGSENIKVLKQPRLHDHPCDGNPKDVVTNRGQFHSPPSADPTCLFTSHGSARGATMTRALQAM